MNDEEHAAWAVDVVVILLAIVVMVGPVLALVVYVKSVLP